MSECSICQSEIKDKINMSCGSQHAFCFECILKNVEVTGELRTCPLCNGGDKFIILDAAKKYQDTDNYYSVYLFVKSLPVIKKILKDKSQNTCIVSEKILQFYVINKTQLEFVHVLSSDYELDEIIKYIKWELLSSNDIADVVMGLAGDYIFGNGGGSGSSSAAGSGRGRPIVHTHFSQGPFGSLFSQ